MKDDTLFSVVLLPMIDTLNHFELLMKNDTLFINEILANSDTLKNIEIISFF